MVKRRQDPAELRERAVRLVQESVRDGRGEWEAMRSIAEKLGVGSPETVRKWVRTAQAGDPVAVKAAADSDEVKRLKAENRELRRTNEILKAAAGFFAAELDRTSLLATAAGWLTALRWRNALLASGPRPKEAKLARLPRLRLAVEQGLEQEWSPEQISHRLRLDHPDDEGMRISHEAIYLSLFRPDRPLERHLGRHLRTGRTIRGPRVAKRSSGRGRLRDMVPITARPAEVEGRQVPRHWEGDLVMGRRPSAVATLVERSSRFLVLVALPDGLASNEVRPHVVTALRSIPSPLRRFLTWDRGREMATHQQLTAETGCPVYFCAPPRSPWQRGTNENTNGLLRHYLGKSADLSIHSQHELDTLAARLNNPPRKVLAWRTPAEVHRENIARMAVAR